MTKAEESTIPFELLYRAINESSNGIVITDPKRPDNPIVFVNRAYEILTGYSAQEVLGRNPRFLQGPKTDPEAREKLREAVREKKARTVTVLNYRKDGSPFWNEITISPVFDDSGNLIHFIGVKTDITERKRLEDKFRTVFETAPNGLVVVNREGRMVMVNSDMEKIFGYPREELVGQLIEMLVPERYRSRHPSLRDGYMTKPIRMAMGSRQDLSGLCKDGSEIAIEIGLSPLETEEGLMVLASVVDVTEKRKIALMEKEFTAIVSHELRTPLTSIRGSLGLIAGGMAGEFPAQSKQLLKIAMTNCERLVRLINNILDIEKIESGTVTLHLEPREIGSLIEETIEANRGFGVEYGVTLALKNILRDAKVLVDGDLLIRVLTNLISNAIKFSPRGGVVEVTVSRRGDFLRTAVSDRGPGIPEKFRDLVFKKFMQAAAFGNPRRGGSGLGLSISKALVERMGGQIGFETATDVGTTFYVDLPEWRDRGETAP